MMMRQLTLFRNLGFLFCGCLTVGWAADPPAAVVGSVAISRAELDAAASAQTMQFRKQEYDAKLAVLNDLIEKKLLETEAAKRGVTVDALIDTEIRSKVTEPTEGEIEAFYIAQTGGRGQNSAPTGAAKGYIKQALKSYKESLAKAVFVEKLRAGTPVRVLLEPPRAEMTITHQRVKGPADAPVTIVEFSDFQCSYCAAVQSTLSGLFKKYPGKVRLAFHDFPLAQIHPQAMASAEAAWCANEQGKFWEYHDVLYANQEELGSAELKQHAKTVGLDQEKYDACVASGRYRASVQADMADARRAGVASTPTFFVNGIQLLGAQPAAAFEKAIDEELARRAAR